MIGPNSRKAVMHAAMLSARMHYSQADAIRSNATTATTFVWSYIAVCAIGPDLGTVVVGGHKPEGHSVQSQTGEGARRAGHIASAHMARPLGPLLARRGNRCGGEGALRHRGFAILV